MKKKLVLLALGTLTLASCQTQPKEDYSWIKKGLDVASAQLELTAEEISSTNMLPRSIRTPVQPSGSHRSLLPGLGCQRHRFR